MLLASLLMLTALPTHAQSNFWFYRVQPGENPWSITRTYFRDGLRYWQPLIARNAITQPRYIPPGTVLTIPASWLRVVPSAATLANVQGDVVLERGAEARQARAGDRLTGHERLRTGAGSTALIRLANGSELLVVEDSEIVLDGLSGYANTLMVDAKIRLVRGRLEGQTSPAGSLDQLQLQSPIAVSAVRGTQLRVATGADADRVEVLEGRVEVRASGRTRAVGAGRGTIARPGRPPEPPRALLPPPRLVSGSERLERLPLRVGVEPVEGAVAYRVQIAPDAAFDELLVDEVDVGPWLTAGFVDDGRYALRVRAIAADGLEGRNTERDVVVHTQPPPPLLIEPPADGRNRLPRATFRWAEVEGASGYRFRLDPGLTTGIDVVLPPGDGYTLPRALPNGRYRWRVATLDADGRQGPYSDLQVFEQLEPTPSVDGPPTFDSGDDGRMLRWVDAGTGYRYRVQIALDRSFDAVLVDQIVTSPSVPFEGRPGTANYVRVAVIEPDGYEAPFGAINRIDLPPTPWWPVILVPFLLVLVL